MSPQPPTHKKTSKERARKTGKRKKITPLTLTKFPLSGRESYTGKYKVNICPNSKEKIIKLANEMIEWAVTDGEAYAIEDFPLSKCLVPSEFYKCGEWCEYLKRALEITRYIIGSRLQAAARTGEIDSKFVLKILPMYNQDFKDLMLMKIKLFQKSIEAAPVRVVLEQFPSSDLVPERKHE